MKPEKILATAIVTLTAIFAAIAFTGCSNLTPEQNDKLLNAGIGIGTAAATKALNQK